MPELVSPHPRYKESFLAAVKEFQAEGLHNYTNLDINSLAHDFDSYIQQLLNESRGVALPEGYVAHTLLWLVEGEEFIGSVDIRHELNDHLLNEGGNIGYNIRPNKRRQGYGKTALKLAIDQAHKLGINEILITCDVNNVGSNKIIQANGGILENEVGVGGGKPRKNRYWIK